MSLALGILCDFSVPLQILCQSSANPLGLLHKSSLHVMWALLVLCCQAWRAWVGADVGHVLLQAIRSSL